MKIFCQNPSLATLVLESTQASLRSSGSGLSPFTQLPSPIQTGEPIFNRKEGKKAKQKRKSMRDAHILNPNEGKKTNKKRKTMQRK